MGFRYTQNIHEGALRDHHPLEEVLGYRRKHFVENYHSTKKLINSIPWYVDICGRELFRLDGNKTSFIFDRYTFYVARDDARELFIPAIENWLSNNKHWIDRTIYIGFVARSSVDKSFIENVYSIVDTNNVVYKMSIGDDTYNAIAELLRSSYE